MALRNFSLRTGVVLTILLFACFSTRLYSQRPGLVLEAGRVWVKGIEPEVLYTFSRYFNTQKDWEAVFPVTLKENLNGIVVTGSYDVFPDAIRFTPRFPFAPNVMYEAKFFAAELALNKNEVYLPTMDTATLILQFSPDASNKTIPSVDAVYPSADVLPENLLKFHVHFSKSMTVGAAYQHIKLLDGKGNEIEKPFLLIDQELWDREMKTLTILFDPGRIKRGLRPNLEMKPPLTEGHRYSLVIDKGWTDIDGNVTNDIFVKTFSCVAADRTSPNVSKYEVMAPAVETAPLVIDLHEPLDYILLGEAIRVTDSRGNIVDGTIHCRKKETVIEFVPKNPWSETRYTIQFNLLLEDLAGNNLKRLFDEDLTSPTAIDRLSSTLSFQIEKSLR